MAVAESELVPLPEDRELLAAMVLTLLAERKHEQQRAEELQVELLRLQLELERFKKWYYGPRADRLQSTEELSQLLLDFAEQLDHKPIRTMFHRKRRRSSNCGG